VNKWLARVGGWPVLLMAGSTLVISSSSRLLIGSVDWAGLGQWVGGVGSIAAAGVAVWIATEGWRRVQVERDDDRRKEQAGKFAVWVDRLRDVS
jgi:hypothetical protein